MIQKAIGEVVSIKMDKTAVVAVNRLKRHPIYDKRFRVTKKYFVHDPDNSLKVGDRVEISETRPMSAHKCWVVTKHLGSFLKEIEA